MSSASRFLIQESLVRHGSVPGKVCDCAGGARTLRRRERNRLPSPREEPPMILERFKVPAKDQVFVSETAVRRTVTEIFEKLGVSKEDSAEAADVLTMTDLRGFETHGVTNMLRAYVPAYRAGKLNQQPGWRLEREAPATAVIDAEKRLGIIVGPRAMRLAIEKARAVGVGVVTVHNSGHFGAIGHFAMLAAQQDMVGVCFTA